ncbi:MAG: molybdopterin molybdenumtransferase MoeA [Deltaproteobacteria bacterium]|nr:molybdopterin molybdotransferase MoeA [Deltaproteobacteria bacterium]MBW2077309.1 molybdopterin molybdotransferase MoeA [Deltaproteobacteria bacterium]RLB27412.1 MAG: molybdopterin molybdenumtransferase MoeA [Deltaproteobacteria bacterium]
MQTFFKVKTAQEVFESLGDIEPLGSESIPLRSSLGRVLARDIESGEDLPGFHRSTVDGYALAARDTYGASESLPALLTVAGEVGMGTMHQFVLKRGQCALIPTGGMLPEGADAVAMVEYSQTLEEGLVEVTRPVSPLENVIQPDDDVKKGQVMLKRGTLLRPQDLGILAGLGVAQVEVFARARAAIISTGEEVVDISQKPRLGQIRDINSFTLHGLCEKAGAEPIYLGIVGDTFQDLKSATEKGLSQSDVVLLSGGSSVGAKDLTLEAFSSFDGVELIAHGVSISPGKPTIVARKGNKTLWGLPGHPVSTMIIFDVFLTFLFGKLSGLGEPAQGMDYYIEAELDRNVESVTGREDYIRVKLSHGEGRVIATPIFGKSGLISTMIEADGLVRIDMNTEGLYRGDTVRVKVFRS